MPFDPGIFRTVAPVGEPALSANAMQVLERRYLARDESGTVVETPSAMFRRVARAIAAVEAAHVPESAPALPEFAAARDPAQAEDMFYQLMANLEFLPNSPTLMNAGTAMGQLSACFVLPVFDSIEQIFTTVRNMALIHQSGGGTGFSFSRLRPRGDRVKSTMGIASGPVSFMRIFDTATNVIKQGGRRRGANMAVLRVDHPDILDFIAAKQSEGALSHFNISVAVTDGFMDAVARDRDYPLVNPRTGKGHGSLPARRVFDAICAAAWSSGDPGLIFLDEINRKNPTPALGPMEATNPCGELPLLPYESCNLGSINLARMVGEHGIDWDRLRRTVHLAVRFLDNVIDANHYPLPEIAAMSRDNRKIGLGVMGLADALIMLDIAYDSDEALSLADKLMAFIVEQARHASAVLARERGVFANFAGSIYDCPGGPRLRNATVTSIAPTGTISIIAGCSSSIEPVFALSYIREVMDGARLGETHPLFVRAARARGLDDSELLAASRYAGSLRGMDQVPEDLRRVFVTDFDIAPVWHVRMQAAFQRHCDNAVSKTVNLPEDATVDHVRDAFLLAHQLGCKGITVFRYGCKSRQVLYRGDTAPIHAAPDYAGGCPNSVCEF